MYWLPSGHYHAFKNAPKPSIGEEVFFNDPDISPKGWRVSRVINVVHQIGNGAAHEIHAHLVPNPSLRHIQLIAR